MSDADYLAERLPLLGRGADRVSLATLPTPLEQQRIRVAAREYLLLVKRDDLTSTRYGGNKVRKLEYLLAPPHRKGARRIATFGAAGSHHVLATALFARHAGLACTCFLVHQRKTDAVPVALNMLLRCGAEIVPFGGAYQERLATLRATLWRRHTWVIPAGGSSWYGTLGFVNAGLELSAQIMAAALPVPPSIYVASGTSGTAAGLALGLALAELPATVQAIRVSHTRIANEASLRRLIGKTAMMMHRLDRSVPRDLAQRVRIRMRHEFFAGGYARSDAATDAAVAFARQQLGLALETTYTGKAMAALLSDLRSTATDSGPPLFWNTYYPLPQAEVPQAPAADARLPAGFLRYYC